MRECCTTGSIQRDEGSEGLHWLFTNFIGNFRIDKKNIKYEYNRKNGHDLKCTGEEAFSLKR